MQSTLKLKHPDSEVEFPDATGTNRSQLGDSVEA